MVRAWAIRLLAGHRYIDIILAKWFRRRYLLGDRNRVSTVR
jgi:hypothetical protein